MQVTTATKQRSSSARHLILPRRTCKKNNYLTERSCTKALPSCATAGTLPGQSSSYVSAPLPFRSYPIIFCPILSYPLLFYPILFYSLLFYSILFHTLFCDHLLVVFGPAKRDSTNLCLLNLSSLLFSTPLILSLLLFNSYQFNTSHHLSIPILKYFTRHKSNQRAAACVGLVAGATDIPALAAVRAAAPDMWILCPGVGAQGGDAQVS